MLAIVIPAYDMHHQGVHFLRRALESISKQTQIDFSQIAVVVSDHSVDFAIEGFLEGYQTPFELHYVRNGTHFGNISHNLNTAIQFVLQNSLISYIKVLFQDDYLLEDSYLANIFRITQEAKPDAIITGATHTLDGKNYFNPIAPQNNPFLIFGQNTISSPSTLTLSRQVCQEQLCDENVQLFMDVDWYYRIFKAYASIVLVPDLLVVNGIWEGQMQHQFDAQSFAKELSYVLNKYESDGLRARISSYLVLLQEKHPEHVAIVGPLVRPLIERNAIPLDATNLSSTQHSIDVVLTTYNAADQINFSIRNVLSQSVPPKKIIVVDANSSDHTAQMVRRIYAQELKVRLISCPNSQIWEARQLGIAQSDSTYIAFLHCTSENNPKWDLNYLKYQVENMPPYPDKIGSLGTISTDIKCSPRLPLVIQLPLCGLASNIVIKRSALLNNSQLNDQLRLAEMHSQWQLLALLFQLSATNNAQVRVMSDETFSSVQAIKRVSEIFSWWSNYADIIQSSTNLLYLIRNAFIANALSLNISLLRRFVIFNSTFKEIKSSLDKNLFDKACVSYENMATEIARIHFKQVLIRGKKMVSRLPFVVTIYRFIF